MSKDTGGAAFHEQHIEGYDFDGAPGIGYTPGMALRDYFAAKAMQGQVAGIDNPRCNYIAAVAYEMADAMLKERAK